MNEVTRVTNIYRAFFDPNNQLSTKEATTQVAQWVYAGKPLSFHTEPISK
jgi:hypothetical protein